MGISERLQDERKRLGLTQEAVAEKVGATKRSVINWEGGASLPGAEALSRYAAIDADVGYILTGLPSDRSKGARAQSPEETVLLEYFRAASPTVRRAAIGALLGAATPASQVMQNHGGGSHTMIGSISGTYNPPSAPSKTSRRKS
ncbi:helix-turn-helix transcriptional regulator [Diaphorobacter sp. HDW4A]|uniref:helix-turn-helix domain-containing protein n=1 Tax=Diaphorobacter sp. HDW4A TaxID=2714924 RepID=UPI0014074CF6|nr:helix-turn-helix transcriptional regulator [Diaphorobacter sp. HDW4A]